MTKDIELASLSLHIVPALINAVFYLKMMKRMNQLLLKNAN